MDIVRKMKINWNEIGQLLPVKDDKDDKEARRMLFAKFDTEGKGQLTLEEIMKGFRDIGKRAQCIVICEKAVGDAFDLVKRHLKSKGVKHNFADISEFTQILVYMH